MEDDDYGDVDAQDLAAAVEAAERAQGAQAQDQVPTPVPRAVPIAASSSSSSVSKPATTATGQVVKPTVQQPVPQKLRVMGSSIIVNMRQKGNPLLTYIKSVPWEYGPIVADYQLGANACALFLSLKYHLLHPEYLVTRLPLPPLPLRLLLVLVDTDAHAAPLRLLTHFCLTHSLTLLLSWSAPEAAHYLELYKSLEYASTTSIMERSSADAGARVIEALTTVRSVNKTDAVALVSNFGTVRGAVNALPEEILLVQGWGERKVGRWERAVGGTFRNGVKKGGKVGGGRGGRGGRGSGTGVRMKLGIAGVGEEVLEGTGSIGREGWAVEDDEEALRAVAEMEERERAEREKGKGVDRDETLASAPPAVEIEESVASGIMDALAKLRERGH